MHMVATSSQLATSLAIRVTKVSQLHLQGTGYCILNDVQNNIPQTV